MTMTAKTRYKVGPLDFFDVDSIKLFQILQYFLQNLKIAASCDCTSSGLWCPKGHHDFHIAHGIVIT